MEVEDGLLMFIKEYFRFIIHFKNQKWLILDSDFTAV